MLALGALIASLLAVGAGPVSAQPGGALEPTRPDHRPQSAAKWSACVGDAGRNDARFSDVNEDTVIAEALGAINCIAYYDITLGIGDGTYAPDDNVTAFQMELFTQRTADLMGADGDAVLADVELSDPVTRLEMARLMYGLVDDIRSDVRISSNGQIEFRDHDNNEWVVVNDFFADAKAQVPIAYSQVIGATYELGITRGTMGDGTLVSTANSTFEPFAPMTRAEMALFITRTLDHSNARPEGLTIQRNGEGNTMVSYRDADFGPVVDARVDVFSALYPDDALDDDKECVLRFVRDETPSHSTCEIDIGDQLTDDEGNVEFTLVSDSDPTATTCETSAGAYVFSSAPGSEGRTFWAWVGEIGDGVDADAGLVELERVGRPVGAAGPDYLRVSGGLPTNDELAQMGETVTFTAQLRADTGSNGRDGKSLVDDAAAGPDRSGNAYILTVEKYFVARVADTDSDETAKTGSASSGLFGQAPGNWAYALPTGAVEVSAGVPVSQALARFQTPVDTVVWPNADGQFSINLTNPDSQAGVPNTDVGVRFTLMPFPQDNDFVDRNLVQDVVVEANTNYMNDMADAQGRYEGHVIFSDDASDPHNVEASVMGASTWYRIISGSRTGNSVTVSVVDQYGDPMRGVAISLLSDLDSGNPAAGTDQVTYPEEVDITVSRNENGDGDDPANVGSDGTTTVNPTAAATSLTAATIRAAERAAVAAWDATDNPSSVQTRTLTVAVRVNDDADNTVAAVPTDDAIGTFRTRSNGAYRIGYNYINPTLAQTEMITPQSTRVVRLLVTSTSSDGDAANVTSTVEMYELDDDGDPVATTTLADATVTLPEVGDAVYVYWADVGNSGSSVVEVAEPNPDMVEILVADVASRTIVVNEGDATGDNPQAYFYDENDTFIVDNRGATLETFEEALGLTSRDNGVYADMVSWENYTLVRDTGPNRPAQVGRTIWEISLTCSDTGPDHPRTGS